MKRLLVALPLFCAVLLPACSPPQATAQQPPDTRPLLCSDALKRREAAQTNLNDLYKSRVSEYQINQQRLDYQNQLNSAEQDIAKYCK